MFSVHSKYKYSEKYLIGAFIGGICTNDIIIAFFEWVICCYDDYKNKE
jgi:hypothetical protein